MANEQKAEPEVNTTEEALSQPPPPSLLDVIEARMQREGQRLCLTHILLVATTTTDAGSALEFHREAVAQIQQGQASASASASAGEPGITGLLLVQERALVHYFEAAPATATAFLRHLHQRKVTATARVLLSSEDCDRRHFDGWTCHEVSVPPEGEVNFGAEDPVNIATDTLTTLLRFNAGEKPANISPSEARCQALTSLDAFFSLTDYLEMFDSSIRLILDSELVWPIQPTVSYAGI